MVQCLFYTRSLDGSTVAVSGSIQGLWWSGFWSLLA